LHGKPVFKSSWGLVLYLVAACLYITAFFLIFTGIAERTAVSPRKGMQIASQIMHTSACVILYILFMFSLEKFKEIPSFLFNFPYHFRDTKDLFPPLPLAVLGSAAGFAASMLFLCVLIWLKDEYKHISDIKKLVSKKLIEPLPVYLGVVGIIFVYGVIYGLLWRFARFLTGSLSWWYNLGEFPWMTLCFVGFTGIGMYLGENQPEKSQKTIQMMRYCADYILYTLYYRCVLSLYGIWSLAALRKEYPDGAPGMTSDIIHNAVSFILSLLFICLFTWFKDNHKTLKDIKRLAKDIEALALRIKKRIVTD